MKASATGRVWDIDTGHDLMITKRKEDKTMKVTVDEDKCCGAGTCVLVAPDVFDQRDEDGIVILLDARPAEHHAAVRESVQVCPAGRST